MRANKLELIQHSKEISEGANIGLYSSQFGEDVVLWHYLKNVRGAFYVDVGAHDPFRFSNTFLLHKFRNWAGINIDTDQRAIDKFVQHRGNDINLKCAVSNVCEDIEFTEFKDGAVNTADPMLRERQEGKYQKTRSYIVQTTTLTKILEDHLPDGADFRLLSVDVEGLDLKVLTGLDWKKFAPDFIAVETHGMELGRPSANATHRFLVAKGYDLISHTVVTSIYRRSDRTGGSISRFLTRIFAKLSARGRAKNLNP